MYFETGSVYHVFNQGNNRQQIFFTKENYRFFLRKIRTHVLPYADVIAYCLMPNHFHLMVEVNHVELPLLRFTDGVTISHPVSTAPARIITLNTSIGIMLRSYTRAINIQESRSGALFREETKAICLTAPQALSPQWYKNNGITYFWRDIPGLSYPFKCLHYIHQNPVVAGIVKEPGEWEFSSYPDIMNNKENSIVNLKKARHYLLTT